MPGFVLTNSQASRPLNTPQLMADHSFSCHFADTQIFLSTDEQNISSSSSASNQAEGKTCCFLFVWSGGGLGNLGIACGRKSTQVKWRLSVFSPRWHCSNFHSEQTLVFIKLIFKFTFYILLSFYRQNLCVKKAISIAIDMQRPAGLPEKIN